MARDSAAPRPIVPAGVPLADGVCPACGDVEDLGMLMLVSLGGERPVRCTCGGLLFHPAPPPVMPHLAGRYRARPERQRRA